MPKVQVVNAAGHQQCMTGRDGAQNSAAFLISHSLFIKPCLYITHNATNPPGAQLVIQLLC